MSDEDNHEIWCRFCHEDQRIGGQYCCDEYKEDCLDKENRIKDIQHEAYSFMKRNGFAPKYGFYENTDRINILDLIEWLKTKGMK